MNPCTLTTRKGITRNSQDLTNGCSTECMQTFPVYIIGDIERRTLFDDIERAAITLQLTLTGAESFDLFAILVIDVVPVLRCLDMAYTLPPKSECREQQNYYKNDILHKTVCKDNYNYWN